jgi:hypothetical protein
MSGGARDTLVDEENCLPLDFACHGTSAIASAFGGALEDLAESVGEAVTVATAAIASGWVLIGTPDLTTTGDESSPVQAGASSSQSGELVELMNYIAGIGLVVCVVSLIWLAMLVGASIRRGEGALHVGRGGAILAGAVLIGAAGSIAGAFMPEAPQDAAGATLFLQSALWWYTAAVAAIAVIIGGIRMAWYARAEEGKELVKGLLTLLVVAGFGVVGTQMLVTLTDSFSIWILFEAIDCNVSRSGTDCFGENMLLLLPFQQATIGPILTIVLGLIAILVSAFQVLLMVARSGMLVILAGLLPISAAATNTEMGKAWFKRSIGWLLAFILYKPAAAIVYAAAFRLMDTDVFRDDGDGLIAVLTGLLLMVLALFALKALMEFVTPLVSAVGAGSGGGAAAAAALAAMPTGAAQLSGLVSGNGSSSTPETGSNGASSSNATGAADGGSGPAGAQGVGGASTSGGSDGAGTADATGGAGKAAAGARTGAPVPAGASAAGAGGGAAGGAATGAGAAAEGGAAAGGGAAAAGAAAGPVGIAAGAALDVATKAGEAAAGAAQAIGQESAGQQQEEGPSGSR